MVTYMLITVLRNYGYCCRERIHVETLISSLEWKQCTDGINDAIFPVIASIGKPIHYSRSTDYYSKRLRSASEMGLCRPTHFREFTFTNLVLTFVGE